MISGRPVLLSEPAITRAAHVRKEGVPSATATRTRSEGLGWGNAIKRQPMLCNRHARLVYFHMLLY